MRLFASGGSVAGAGTPGYGGSTSSAAGSSNAGTTNVSIGGAAAGSGGTASGEAGAGGDAELSAQRLGERQGAVAVSVSGKRGAVTYTDGTVEVVNLASGSVLQVMHAPLGFIAALGGDWVAWTTTVGWSLVAQRVGDAESRVVPTTDIDAFSTPSVDAGRIAFEGAPVGGGNRSIWLYDLGTQELKRITSPGFDEAPRLRGSWLIFNRATSAVAVDLASGNELPLSQGQGDQELPSIDAGIAVWTRNFRLPGGMSLESDVQAYSVKAGQASTLVQTQVGLSDYANIGKTRPRIASGTVCWTSIGGQLFVQNLASAHTARVSVTETEPASWCDIDKEYVAWIRGQDWQRVAFARKLPTP
jgi:hypothetical protein